MSTKNIQPPLEMEITVRENFDEAFLEPEIAFDISIRDAAEELAVKTEDYLRICTGDIEGLRWSERNWNIVGAMLKSAKSKEDMEIIGRVALLKPALFNIQPD